MESVLILGAICIGQAVYAYYLINKMSKIRMLLGMIQMGLVKVAEGEVRVVRTTNGGVQFEVIKEN